MEGRDVVTVVTPHQTSPAASKKENGEVDGRTRHPHRLRDKNKREEYVTIIKTGILIKNEITLTTPENGKTWTSYWYSENNNNNK